MVNLIVLKLAVMNTEKGGNCETFIDSVEAPRETSEGNDGGMDAMV